jgi:hypothetical protein
LDLLPLENRPNEPSIRGCYPWYVHLLSGYALTGAFCWLLVAGIFWRCRRHRVAGTLVAINALLLMVLIWSTMQLEMAWWRLQSLTMTLNLVWAMSAWLVQYLRFGPAERRYHPAEWRRWLNPLLTGALLGLGFAITIAILPAIGERITVLQNGETTVRSLVLWQFFKDLPLGLAMGLLAGAWWAGDRRFTVSHVVSFMAGLAVVLAAETALFGLVALIINGSDTTSLNMLSNKAWALVPGRLHGWQRFLGVIAKYNYISFVAVGMLFGVPDRVRDFLKRSALIVPLLMLLSLSLLLASQGGWRLVQSQIINQTSCANDRYRAIAYNWMEVLLSRYPNHAQWPSLAARLADFRYSRDEIEDSRRLHQQIIHRYSNSNQWHVQATMSRAILASPSFGKPSTGTRLSIPMVNYQDYLSQNWMAVLAAVRYWQPKEAPVSELFIRLRDISQSDEHIKLPKLTSLADLDDAAASLGYELTILPAEAESTQALLKAGLPVMLPVYRTLYLLYGFDDSRGVIQALCFGQLSEKTRSLAVKEAQEVLMLEAEGKGQTKDQLMRIRREADCMWHQEQWRAGRLTDAAPWMAVIHPSHGRTKIAAALGCDVQKISDTHRGLLAAMIALAYFDDADPINCIRWAQIASRNIDAPFVYHAAYLGAELWRHRTERVGTTFQLEKRFAALDEVNQFLQTDHVQRFLHSARERFEQDQDAGRMNWPIRMRLLLLLDRNDPRQRAQMVSLVQANVSTNPSDAAQWRLLADLHALDENLAARNQALAQAWSADPRDAATALAYASGCALLDDPAQADRILAEIDPSKVRQKADYPFCLATIAEWKQQPNVALRYYAQATDMCRFRPEYFLRYGRLLMAQGDRNAAQKALAWAERIDGGDHVRRQVQHAIRQ